MELIVITATALTGFLALTLVFFYLGQKTFPGFGQWTLGGCLIASGYLMIVLRGVLPTSLVIVIQNFMFPLAAVFYLGGMRSFLGLEKMSPGWYAFPIVNLLFAGFSVCSFDSAAWRTVFVSLTFSVPHLFTAALVFRDYARTRSIFSAVIGMEMALASALLLVWAIWSLTVPNFHVLAVTPLHLGFYIALMVLQVVITVSFIMLNVERLNRELLSAQNSLKFSEEKYSKAFHGTPDSITISRMADGKIVEANEAFSSLTGYSKAEALGSTTVILSLWEDEIEREKVVSLLRDQKGIRDKEVRFRVKSGKILDCLFSGETIVLGAEIHVLSIVRDITDRKRAEQEKLVLQSQLFQSQKMEALGTLVGGIAHDFNNMLQIILGYSEFLLNDIKKDDPGYKDLQTIIRTGQGGAELVQKLLALGQQGQVIPVPLDVNHQIRELITLISRTLPQVVKLDVDLTHGPVTILADPSQINQVVMNLAINASEAMPNGGSLKIVTKTVSLDEKYCGTHHGSKPGNYAMLTVTDTGRGMDKETLAKIFDPFFSTKERGSIRGTGLGLSVVRGIVQQQGGHVTCESEPGKGTTFRVYFPVIEESLVSAKTILPTVQSRGAQTILVVEDNVPVAELEQRFLENAGYTVIVANNGKEALEIYQTKKEEISLVILDLLMPEMSGRDCLMELIKIDPSVKVLIASGYSPEDKLHKEISPLVKGFVHKPFAVTELLNETHSVLDSD